MQKMRMYTNAANGVEIIEKELSYKLNGIFFQVQKNLGRFCREKQYGDALVNELNKAGIKFLREYPIILEGERSNIVDFIVEGRILIDLKAKAFIEKEDYYQMKRYLEVANIRLGLVVNFRQKHLYPKRVLNPKFSQHSHVFVDSHRGSGFTLLEFLIYSVILVIFSSAVVGVFIAIGKGQSQVDVRSEVNSNLRFAVERISQDLRAASAVATPATPGGTTANNLVLTVSSVTVEYCVANNQLRRQTTTACNASSEAITSTSVIVNTPTFTRLENTNTVLAKTYVSVRVDLTVTSTDLAGERKFSANKKTTVTLP